MQAFGVHAGTKHFFPLLVLHMRIRWLSLDFILVLNSEELLLNDKAGSGSPVDVVNFLLDLVHLALHILFQLLENA